jgi:hypothetical protein
MSRVSVSAWKAILRATSTVLARVIVAVEALSLLLSVDRSHVAGQIFPVGKGARAGSVGAVPEFGVVLLVFSEIDSFGKSARALVASEATILSIVVV